MTYDDLERLESASKHVKGFDSSDYIDSISFYRNYVDNYMEEAILEEEAAKVGQGREADLVWVL